jgi:hypothetical protein
MMEHDAVRLYEDDDVCIERIGDVIIVYLRKGLSICMKNKEAKE